MNILCVTDFQGLAPWRDRWARLADGRNPFASPLWLEAAVEAVGIAPIHVFLACEGEVLRGALALRLRDGGRMAMGLLWMTAPTPPRLPRH